MYFPVAYLSLIRDGINIFLKFNVYFLTKGETAGRTPLFCASVKNHPEIVEYLIEHNANVNASEDVSFFLTVIVITSKPYHTSVI